MGFQVIFLPDKLMISQWIAPRGSGLDLSHQYSMGDPVPVEDVVTACM